MFRCLSLEALGMTATQSELNEFALSNGFKGFELPLVEFADRVKSHGLPHARRLIDSARLKVAAFRLPVDWCGDDDAAYKRDLERLPELAEIAQQMQCTRALTWLMPGSDARHYHANFEFCRQRLQELAALLDRYGIRLGVGIQAAADLRAGKNFEFIHTFDQLLLLVGMINAKNIGVLVDTWDLYVAGHDVAEMAGKLNAAQVVNVYVAGAAQDAVPSELPHTARRAAGEGDANDSCAVLVALARAGYDGPVTPTPHPSGMAEKNRAALVKQCGESMNYLWKAAGLSPAGKLLATS
ncbi:MAG: sugar phosphate isomerase/epimerase [Pirellulales bacterium]|nr:sugar phosphate isomerase/epimerase [Pirellulales bacterium]